METLFLMLLLAIAPGQFFPVEELRRGLEGIAGLKVEVEGLTDSVKATGLTQDQIKTDVEQRLRSAGIKVGEEFKPYLYIVVYVGNPDPRGSVTRYYANARGRFRQMVTVRENGKTVDAATWEENRLNFGFGSGDGDTLRNIVEEISDAFITDYLAANPKH